MRIRDLEFRYYLRETENKNTKNRIQYCYNQGFSGQCQIPKSQCVRKSIENVGYELLSLPTHSPDLSQLSTIRLGPRINFEFSVFSLIIFIIDFPLSLTDNMRLRETCRLYIVW
jgi:hypothetical protein